MLPPPDDPERPPDDGQAPLGLAARPVSSLARRAWNPEAVSRPAIAADLERLPWPERCAEVVRHALLSAEHWLSRSGWVREWIRLNVWVAVILTVAALLVIPPVTALLEGFRDWAGLVSATAANINSAVASLPPLVLAVATAFLAVKLLRRHRADRRHPRRHDYDEYR